MKTAFPKSLSLLPYILVLLILTGCATLYKPNAVNSPMLKEQGEFGVTTSASAIGSGLMNLQLSVSPVRHLGLMADGMYHFKQSNRNDSTADKLRIYSFDVGAGYYTMMGDSKKWMFQCYNGFGFGKSKDGIDYDYQPDPIVRARYFNVFSQPGIAMTSEYFDMAFDVRINYVHMYDIYANEYEDFDWWNSDFNYYSDTTLNFVNLEPTLTMRMGKGNLKGILQLGLTIPTINADSYLMVNPESWLGFGLVKFSFGLSYTFRRKKEGSAY